ncbi:hypothetical protein B0H19DRAFT_1095254 [Mycena capillaripes]|nr:hypothetical protein B0H19DRAFT_1095254 [Mycena capillaripes]
MTPVSHSFNRPSLVFGEQYPSLRSSHRRYNSEPFNTLLGPRRKDVAFSLFAEQEHTAHVELTLHPLPESGPSVHSLAAPAPVSLRPSLKPQYSIRRPRPNTEFFGSSFSPEIVLGEPKEHVGHPKTRLGQPVLKLAAIKERMELLEAANERLQQRNESYRTDAEMLSSSVTYFSSEYYAGLLTIRDLRARSRQDAEIMSNQEQQLCQLKKFVGLMIEIGLHEPVLERTHESLLAGNNFEPVLVEAIRNAAARRGSAWSGILSAVNVPAESVPVPTVVPTDIFEERRQSTVDDLLKDLKNGNIPSGRHRSASHRFPFNSPARNRSTSNSTLRVKPSNGSGALLSPGSPVRCVLGKLDMNRSPQRRTGQLSDRLNKTATRKNSTTGGWSSTPAAEERRSENVTRSVPAGDDAPFSSQRALASLQHILDNFSSGSFGSLGTTTEGTQSADCDSSAEPEMQPHCYAAPFVTPPPAPKSRACVRPPTARSATKRASVSVASPTRNSKRLTVVVSTKKSGESGSSFLSPGRPCRRDSETPALTTGIQARKAGWR